MQQKMKKKQDLVARSDLLALVLFVGKKDKDLL